MIFSIFNDITDYSTIIFQSFLKKSNFAKYPNKKIYRISNFEQLTDIFRKINK